MSESDSGFEDLERGLAEAYAHTSGGSILHALAALSGGALDTDPDDPVVPQHAARYEVLGEIARGGMGVVMRTRDVDIGRNVAMKVLRPELSHEPEVLRRFVEEAQIGGQLQHPGIVPVYEMGLREDREAYFTMKLIQGRTLSGLLQERADPAQGRTHFLTIFEAICQTIAYAHSRGVIHRDIKPSNVMVGSFGEVQVVDWGFAKVLAEEPAQPDRDEDREPPVHTVRSGSSGPQSQLGSAMGTPAYMPPEQAYGDGEHTDRRSDVFALGATLCEILTGAPPYPKADGNQLVQAAKHHVEGAFGRLDRSGADRELISLAKHCLGKHAQRPADAAEVAERVHAYLTSVEDRAHRAELRAAEEVVKTAEERKRRRLTVALAAAVLLIVAGGGGTLALMEQSRLNRVQRNTLAVSRELQEASRLEARARTQDQVPDWEQALLAAKHARQRADGADVDGDVVVQTMDAVARVEAARAEALARAEQRVADEATRARLREISERLGHSLNYAQMDVDFAAAFHAHGIDVEVLEEGEAAARVRKSAIAEDLCAAMDAWAFGLQGMSAEGVERAKRILNVAAQSDPDAWRASVRRAAAERDGPALQELASKAPVATVTPQSLMLMSRSLAAVLSVTQAVEFLRRVQPAHAANFRINFVLGSLIVTEDRTRAAEGAAFLRAAVAARPESREARHQLGIALEMAGAHESALDVWYEAMRLWPDFHHLWVHIYENEVKLRRLARAQADLDAEIEHNPSNGIAWWRQGILHRIRGEVPKARTAFEKATKLAPDYAPAYRGLSYALSALGYLEKARAAQAEACRLDPFHAYYFLLLGGLHERLGETEEAFRAYERAVAIYPAAPRFRMAVATALVRDHRPDEAMRHYEEMRDLYSKLVQLTQFEYELAQALQAEDYEREARTVAQSAMRRLRAELRDSQGDDAVTAYALQLMGGLLCDVLWHFDEARATFEQAIALKPNESTLHWCVQVALSKKGDLQAAAAWLRQAVARWPRRPMLRQRLATVLCRLGEYEAAEPHVREALRMGRIDPQGHATLRLCCLRDGKYEEALTHHARIYPRITWPQGRRITKDEWDELGRTYVALARRAAPKLTGDAQLEHPREMLLLAFLLQEAFDEPAAVKLYKAALERDPGLADERAPTPIGWPWRLQLASARVKAAGGTSAKAAVLEPAQRREMRALGLAGMREWLVRADRSLAGGDPIVAAQLNDMLRTLRYYLECVRYGDPWEALSEAERTAWSAFWQDVDRVLRRAREYCR